PVVQTFQPEHLKAYYNIHFLPGQTKDVIMRQKIFYHKDTKGTKKDTKKKPRITPIPRIYYSAPMANRIAMSS
ncbi:MAG: hypothetical protein PHU23_19540, partial [Dehalococcoidales bacterium]|nr:hypothetical protein [Dehalococcoidales bacterium]